MQIRPQARRWNVMWCMIWLFAIVLVMIQSSNLNFASAINRELRVENNVPIRSKRDYTAINHRKSSSKRSLIDQMNSSSEANDKILDPMEVAASKSQ